MTLVIISQLDQYGLLRVPPESSTAAQDDMDDDSVETDGHEDGEEVPLLIAEK
jgi:hypothetical protein